MVRLLPKANEYLIRVPSTFQSHNGAIAAHLPNFFLSIRVKGFNPTMVRLLPLTAAVLSFTYRSFNPTMVRLLPFRIRSSSIVRQSFNPTMVRLLRAAGLPTPTGIE